MATKAEDQDGLAKTCTEAGGTAVHNIKDAKDAKDTKDTKDAKEVTPPKPVETPSFENAPDPDEDDLDDLDDMLDEFSHTKTEPKDAAPFSSGSGQVAATATATDNVSDLNELSEEDFAKHLQAGMADLLGGTDTNPELAAQFEAMMSNIASGRGIGDIEAPIPRGATEAAPSSKAPAGTEESFQDTIKKTMEKIQASGEQATAASKEEDSDDVLAELLKQMQASGLDNEGGEEDFSKMLLGMMEQLTNKDILYEPMKELNEKFPAWMAQNRASIDKADLARYEEQQRVVAEIVTKFEEKTYTDASVPDREYIVERMQLMQSAGSPPADLVGDMASAQEAFSAPDEGCPQQ